VQARRWFTKEHDGLQQSWKIPEDGWLFMNCPWNAPSVGEQKPIPLWTDKLMLEMSCGNVPRAVTLLPFKRSASFDKIKAAGAAIINLGRLKYGGAAGTSRDDTACCLLGFTRDQVDALVAALKRHGLGRAELDRYGGCK